MIALLYDIHGNDTALQAVIDDASAAGADAWLLGGDYCLFGAEPAAVLDRLETLPAETIWLRGNTERWLDHPDAKDIPAQAVRDAALFTAGAVGHESVKELAALPDVVHDVPFAGAANTTFCHASPRSDMLGFRAEPAESDDRAAGNDFEANTIVCGHTHEQFIREVGVIEVVNPGSVGLPFDGDTRAAWALLREDGSFELRRTEYDVERALVAYDGLTGEWVEIARKRIATARA